MTTVTGSRISRAFREKKRPLFIPYVTAGDPTMDITIELLAVLEHAGADMIELGVPYSDPLADGPVIQAASERALKHGVTLKSVLDSAKEARRGGVTAPLVLCTYINPVIRMGMERLCEQAAVAGIDGIIVPDLPPEENDALLQLTAAHGLALIPLVAPTSDKRLQTIVSQARGFVYCVSSLGTTGTRDTFDRAVLTFLDRVRRLSPVPTAVGFGVSKREHVENFAPHVDAVIVGSALVREIEAVQELLADPLRRKDGLEHIRRFVKRLKNG